MQADGKAHHALVAPDVNAALPSDPLCPEGPQPRVQVKRPRRAIAIVPATRRPLHVTDLRYQRRLRCLSMLQSRLLAIHCAQVVTGGSCRRVSTGAGACGTAAQFLRVLMWRALLLLRLLRAAAARRRRPAPCRPPDRRMLPRPRSEGRARQPWLHSHRNFSLRGRRRPHVANEPSRDHPRPARTEGLLRRCGASK